MPSHADRQRRRARKAARQKKRQRKKAAAICARSDPAARHMAMATSLEVAATWPIHEVLISERWDEPLKLVQVLVARRGPDGQVAAATFLVDLACLGAKDGFASIFPSTSGYQALRRGHRSNMPMETGCAALAAKIVREGIRYARDLGFEPHPDAAAALPLLGDPGDSPVEVPLGGPDGKPLYIQGPHDDPRRILDRLDRGGRDGYDSTVRGDSRSLAPGARRRGPGAGRGPGGSHPAG